MVAIASSEQQTLPAVSLSQLLSRKSQAALRGILGSREQPIGDGKSFNLPRTNGEAFFAFLTDMFGWEQFCIERQIPHDNATTRLVDQACLELELSDDFRQETIGKLKIAECAPALLYTQQEEGVWARLKEVAPESYEAFCPAMTKRMIQRSLDEKAQRQERYAKSLKPQQESKLVPAPNTSETQAIVAFRNSLTASKLRTWKAVVGVLEPFNSDKLGRISDFSAKFQKHGYDLDDRSLREVGGLTAEMQLRLGRLQALYEADLANVSVRLIAAVEPQLQSGVIEFPGLNASCTVAGETGNFIVSHGDKPVLTALNGAIVTNYLHPSVMAVLLAQRAD